MVSSLSDQDVASQSATLAATYLRERRHGSNNDFVGSAIDREADRIIASFLKRHRPYDAVFSEETREDGARLERERVWIVDPLDGSIDYYGGGMQWAVHVALVEHGIPTASAVIAPMIRRSERDRDGVDARNRPLTVALSSAHADQRCLEIVRLLGGVPVYMSSAGVKTLAVVDGAADVYIHAGGQYEWDSAAPVGVARSAGLHASRLNGSQLVYNQPDPWMPDLLICRTELVKAVLTRARAAGF